MRDADPCPLLALIPPLGLDGKVYSALAARLAKKVDVITLEYPEFGEEPDGPATLDWSARDLLTELAAYFLAQLRRRAPARAPAMIGGVSLGGTLCYLLAREVRPAAMLLMAPGGLPVAGARKGAILEAMRELSPEAFARRSLGITEPVFEASGFAAHFAEPGADARCYFEHLVSLWSGDALSQRERLQTRARGYGAMLRAALDVDLGAALANNLVPTDLVWGEHDRVFSTRVFTKYARALASSRFHLLPRVGHFAPLEVADTLAGIILARLGDAPA